MKYPVADGNIVDFVGDAHATQLDPAQYDHGIDDHWAFTSYERIRRCLADRWPASLGSVLEIGCGSGAFSRALLSRDVLHDIVLTDVSVDMLRICVSHLERLRLASRVPLTLATYSTYEHCFRDAVFDTCIGIQVLHHIPDVNGFLAEALRVLKPGGRALFVEPNRLFIGAVAAGLAEIVALLLSFDARPSRDLQLLLNWIAQARQGVLHQGDMDFLATFEDKHMFAGDAFERAALELGFAGAEALPATPDPDAANFVGSLLGTIGTSSGFATDVLQWLPEFVGPHVRRLDPKDLSQSYVFWLVKPIEQRAYSAPPLHSANEPAAGAAFRPVAVAPDGGLPPRWHIEVTLDVAPDAVSVTLSGWCLLTADVRWIRVRIDDQSRDAAVWYPRADVHLAFNQAGGYAPWNSLCCGVTGCLRFDSVGGAGRDLSLTMQIILMDGGVIDMRPPPDIRIGETFLLVPPTGAAMADLVSVPGGPPSLPSPPTGEAGPRVVAAVTPPDQPPASPAAEPAKPPAGAFKFDIVLPALWTDRPNWVTQLRALAATGFVDQTETDQLAHFADHGWLLMPQAIEPALIDRLVADIDNLHQTPGMFVSTDRRAGGSHHRGHKLNGNQADDLESLYDLFVNLPSSRRVCMHPAITRFLSLVFQSKVLAFRQLLLQRSDGRQWHQDTAEIAVDTPTLLAATWIALRDVAEGSGEPAYYDRSHRLPHYMFNHGTTKQLAADTDEAQYSHDLEEACQSRQLSHQRLVAKKGDVFVSTADLVHRSHPRSLPSETPLVACVTHYCPATSVPQWFSHPEKRGIEPWQDAGGFASAFYKLPNLGKPVRPELPAPGLE